MKGVFASAIASLWKPEATNIDNFVFRLHYKWTSLFLLAFSVVVTARQYIGHPIHCMLADKAKITEDLLNEFCWTGETFSVKEAWKKEVGKEVVYPGVDNSYSQDLVYHTYYQWVCFLLFIQALLFYAPRYFWKNVEGKRIHRLAICLIDVTFTDEQRESGIKSLVNYMERHRNHQNLYFWGFAVAEIINFVSVLGQMFMLDRFLGGKFMSYGIDVMRFDNWTPGGIHHNPMIELFPRVTKCLYYYFGPTGTIQKTDHICVLSINIINEKIYLFIWFWFCFLLTMSSLALVYRLLVLVLPRARLMALRTRACHAKCSDLEMLVYRSDIGDWFLLKLLAKNIDPLDFRDFVAEYVKTTFDRNGNSV